MSRTSSHTPLCSLHALGCVARRPAGSSLDLLPNQPFSGINFTIYVPDLEFSALSDLLIWGSTSVAIGAGAEKLLLNNLLGNDGPVGVMV